MNEKHPYVKCTYDSQSTRYLWGTHESHVFLRHIAGQFPSSTENSKSTLCSCTYTTHAGFSSRYYGPPLPSMHHPSFNPHHLTCTPALCDLSSCSVPSRHCQRTVRYGEPRRLGPQFIHGSPLGLPTNRFSVNSLIHCTINTQHRISLNFITDSTTINKNNRLELAFFYFSTIQNVRPCILWYVKNSCEITK